MNYVESGKWYEESKKEDQWRLNVIRSEFKA